MKPDVLFWFYKDYDTCRERLVRLRRLNPEVQVFALFGGPPAEAPAARDALGQYFDDFYAFPEEREPRWKWQHGDQLIAAWYEQRGRELAWDSIFVMQWDMVILEPLEKLFRGLQQDEILLSGFRPLKEVADWWPRAKPENSDIREFEQLMREDRGYSGELYACLFIVACLPRVFLEKYVAIGHPETGFLEYKIPTLAVAFDIPVCQDHDFHPWWRANPATRRYPAERRTLNAVGEEVPLPIIVNELAKPQGKRLFHPVFRPLPKWVEYRHMPVFYAHLYGLRKRLKQALHVPDLIIGNRG